MPYDPDHHDPAQLRSIFGDNLKQLSQSYSSVAALCRDLDINRTQFNRYLSGESFPRPDVMHKICKFFDVDARILLEPIEQLLPYESDLLEQPFLQDYFDSNATNVSEETFPSGFFRYTRHSFIVDGRFAVGLVHVRRENDYTYLRGFEPRDAMRRQGLSIAPGMREFRGIILRQGDGVVAVVMHKASLACSFNFLSPDTSFQTNLWEGYVTRTGRERLSSTRAARMIYEYLGTQRKDALRVARQCGMVPREDIKPFHQQLLRIDEEFR